MFKKYHYLNDELHQASEQYVGIVNNEIVCHTGIIQMPMKKGKKRVHRLVVLPDYQGVGIGTKFIKEVAKMVTARGYEVNLTTTTPQLVHALKKDSNWVLGRFGRCGSNLSNFNRYGSQNEHLANAKSNNRVTYSFWYKS